MKSRVQERIYLCKDCGNLDYARGCCKKCNSTNLEIATEQMNMGVRTHSSWMKYILDQQLFAVEEVK